MKIILSAVLLLHVAMATGALAQGPQSFPLWSGAAPGALGEGERDIPTLTVYPAALAKRTGAAMVICPGGGYGGLADHEGRVYAQWLSDHGITGFVLKYRLGSAGYRHPVMLQDASRAIRLVRARAAEWNVDPGRVGIMGSSAGGHLASTVLTHFDAGDLNATDVIERQSSRPDLGVLCYPVITMGRYTHRGSRNNLLGTNASPELVEFLSNELQVTKDTPPSFVWHTVDDTVVPVENSLHFAEALRKAGVPFDLHLYEKGRHGLGLGIRGYPPGDGEQLLPWTADLLYWLKQRGWAP